ncbi:hypothetical protein JW935_20320 [candidate division KSB1 bacterium]|nr:hypothetical protein [candidate division KSB1 bacterium]
MITKEDVKAEIENIKDEHLSILYKIIKIFESSAKERDNPNIDLRNKDSEKRSTWRKFIHETYGCLSNSPIDRGPQGTFEVREGIN